MQGTGNFADRGDMGDIIGHVVAEALHDGGIFEIVLLLDVADDEGVEDIGDVMAALFFGVVGVGAGKAAHGQVFGEGLVLLAHVGGIVEIIHIFFEGEGEDFDGESAADEEGGELVVVEEGIGAGDVEVVFALGVEAIDGELEIGAHLDFVYEDKIALAGLVATLDVGVEGVVFAELLGVDAGKVDAGNDRIGIGSF